MITTRTSRPAAGVLVAAAATLALAACGGTTDDAEPEAEQTTVAPASEVAGLLPEEIADRGVLRIGVSPNFPPMNFQNDDGGLDGSEIDLGLALGDVLGLEIQHETTNFAGLLTGLEADHFDIVLSGMNATLERQEQATFVNYLSTGSNLLVHADNPHGIETVEDLCGRVAAETIGTTYIDQLEEVSAGCVDAGQEPIDIQTFPSGVEVTQAIATGRADASFANAVANLHFVTQSEGTLAVTDAVINPQLTGLVVPKDDTELVDALAAAVQELMDSGRLAELMSEWGIEDAVLEEVVIDGAES